MSHFFQLHKLLEGQIQNLSLDKNNLYHLEAFADFSIPLSKWKSAHKVSIQQYISMNQLFFQFQQNVASIYHQSLDHKFVEAQEKETSLIQSMMFPIPNTLRCQICNDKFHNYLKHINIDFHLTKMKKFSDSRMVKKLVRMINKTRPQYRLKKHLINQPESLLVHSRKRNQIAKGNEPLKRKTMIKKTFNNDKESSKNK